MMACRHVCKIINNSLNILSERMVSRMPTLFSIMFSAMLMDALEDSDTGFQSGTVLMATNLTLDGCKPNLRCRLMC